MRPPTCIVVTKPTVIRKIHQRRRLLLPRIIVRDAAYHLRHRDLETDRRGKVNAAVDHSTFSSATLHAQSTRHRRRIEIETHAARSDGKQPLLQPLPT
jgi:hypothetical protein